jgi:hypothetical protein
MQAAVAQKVAKILIQSLPPLKTLVLPNQQRKVLYVTVP